MHHVIDIKGALYLSDDVAHHRVRDESSEFRCPERYHLALLAISHLRERVIPPGLDDRILDRIHALLLEIIISEKPDEISEGSSSWIIHERQDPVAEIILDPRSEDLVSEELEHDIHRILCDRLLLIFSSCFQKIHSHGTGEVCRIEVDDIIGTMPRDVWEQIIRKISMRIHDRDSFPVLEVLPCHDLDKAGFSGSGLSDDIEVPESVDIRKPDLRPLSSIVVMSEDDALLRESDGGFHELICLPFDLRRLIVSRMREVEERGNLFDIQDAFALLEPSRREIAEDRIVDDFGIGNALILYDRVVSRRAELGERSDDILELSIDDIFVDSRCQDSDDNLKPRLLPFLLHELLFLLLILVFLFRASFLRLMDTEQIDES